MDSIYNTSGYKRSRKAYALQCTFEYLITVLATDAFLANLLSHIGISDSLIGIISSFVSFAFLFQLLSIFLVNKITNTKKTVVAVNCLSMLLFMCIYIVPFTPFSKTVKTVSIMAFIIFAYVFNYMLGGVLFKWANSFVDPTKRAEYSAGKEVISLVTGIIFTLIVGKIIDHFTDIGNIEGGFLFTAVIMFILNVCNFISLMLIKKDSAVTREDENNSISFKEALKNTLGNKNFVSIVIMTVLWYSANYMTIGFMGIYKTKDLALSVGFVQIINIIANIARIALSKPFGRFTDRNSFAVGMRSALMIACGAYFINIFTMPKTWWFIIIYQVLYNISVAGTNQNSFNIVYSYVDSKYIVQAMAIKNSIGGICGFLVSLLAGKILGVIQSNGNTFLGLHVYGQQVLSAISFLLLVITVLYIHFVIEKQEVKIQ